MPSPLQLVIHGASGRNGKRLIAIGSADPEVTLVGAIVRPNSPSLGIDAGTQAGVAELGLHMSAVWPNIVDVAIDFSSPEGSQHALDHCASNKVPLVIASTGLSPSQIESIERASKLIPICYAPNMSVAVNLTMKKIWL